MNNDDDDAIEAARFIFGDALVDRMGDAPVVVRRQDGRPTALMHRDTLKRWRAERNRQRVQDAIDRALAKQGGYGLKRFG